MTTMPCRQGKSLQYNKCVKSIHTLGDNPTIASFKTVTFSFYKVENFICTINRYAILYYWKNFDFLPGYLNVMIFKSIDKFGVFVKKNVSFCKKWILTVLFKKFVLLKIGEKRGKS
jgi:hypothetical protein